MGVVPGSDGHLAVALSRDGTVAMHLASLHIEREACMG